LGQRGQRFGAAQIIDILRGARSERVLSRGHDTLSVYGIGKQHSLDAWRSVARALLHQGLIDETQDGYPVLSLNARSGAVLREELAVRIAVPAKRRRTATDAAPAGTAQSDELFDRLRALRKRLADEHGLPPYVVFHDSTLRQMAHSRPVTLSQFAKLPGVGQAKLARYGESFIAAIGEFSSL
jgi:ATP-dependent DNA helicase RecQ